MDFKVWSMNEMLQFIRRIKEETNSKRNNTHAQWLCKQDLYKLKWAIEDALLECDTYEDEEKFVKSYQNRNLLKKIANQNVKKS